MAAPAGTDAAKGNAALSANFPQASANPTNIVMRFATSVWQDPAVLQTATAGLRATGSFTQLSGPLDPNGSPVTTGELEALHAQLPSAKELVDSNRLTPTGTSISPVLYTSYLATARYISTDGRTVQWEAGLEAGDPGSTPALNAVPALRRAVDGVARAAGAQAVGVAGEAPRSTT